MGKRPVLFVIILGVVLTLLVSIATGVSVVNQLDDQGTLIAQTAAFLVMAVLLTIYINKRGNEPSLFGFKKILGAESKAVLYYVPLLVIALVQPVMMGLNKDLGAGTVALILVFTILVGYTEELLFRGITRQLLRSRGVVFYIVFSSLFFGVLHMANALNQGALYGALLVINAFLIGLMLSTLYVLAENILPLIAFHALYDFLAKISVTSPVGAVYTKEMYAIILLNILYLAYFIFLFTKIRKKNPTFL